MKHYGLLRTLLRTKPLVHTLVAVFFIVALVVVAAGAGDDVFIYLPVISQAEEPEPETMVEFRGLWVTRFDFTRETPSPATVDKIVADAAMAGFNVILFQVRGTADALYDSPLEPWSARLTGTLGEPPNPYWDPLAYLVQRAHAAGIEVHAYINVYPVWLAGSTPPHTTPEHLYHLLAQAHGTSDGRLNGLQWNTAHEVAGGSYQRATPASFFVDEHLVAVATDLVTRYEIDGLHLDHIRYDGGNTSCDPVSESRAGVPCFHTPPGYASYGDWQRAQVNGTVSRFYEDVIVPANRKLWLSAAVWPIYRDYWNWGIHTGYDYYYQDSQAWLAGGYIDSISPMIYGSSFWTQSVWQTLVANFQAHNAGRYVIPGIHGNYDDFGEITTRIEMGRQLGTAGHAIFAYGYLDDHDYFDDLAAGPYATPAVLPPLPWHP